MICPITITKFVGTISLGLLTGLSYNASIITLPSLALLPTASSASRTLSHIQAATARHAISLASISSISLLLCYKLASRRNKHPYLLWTSLMACIGGHGVEYYFNRFERFPRLSFKKTKKSNGSKSYVMVEDEGQDEEESGNVNGEKVEMEMEREKKVQGIRALVSGIGFAMAVVGIWGDGA